MKLAALVSGPGAGSKLLHTLLDNTADLYIIPGYCLMYFYPHYFEIIKRKPTYRSLIFELLDKLPTLYDTRIMPGSESLNSLGINGKQFLAVTKTQFADQIFELRGDQEKGYTSRQVLIDIHKAHYLLFGNKEKYPCEPGVYMADIHVDLYLNKFKRDFPEAPIIATMRRPSVNLDRRTASSLLEADKVKLSSVDYLLLETFSCAKMAKFHYRLFREHKRIKKDILYVNYDDMIKDERKTINKVREKLGLYNLKEEEKIVPTFAGITHGLPFYEKARGITTEEMRADYFKQVNKTPVSSLDEIYWKLTVNQNGCMPNIIQFSRETLTITPKELRELRSTYSSERLRRLIRLLKDEWEKGCDSYNMNHGYYRYKWSSHCKYFTLTSPLYRLTRSRSVLKKKCTRLFIIIIHLVVYILGLACAPALLIRKKSYQIMLYSLIPLNER